MIYAHYFGEGSFLCSEKSLTDFGIVLFETPYFIISFMLYLSKEKNQMLLFLFYKRYK